VLLIWEFAGNPTAIRVMLQNQPDASANIKGHSTCRDGAANTQNQHTEQAAALKPVVLRYKRLYNTPAIPRKVCFQLTTRLLLYDAHLIEADDASD
jgi:hypothetical protein